MNVINGKRTMEVKDSDVQITLYVPKELVADVGVLPKVKNLSYISTTEEEHPKEFKGKIATVFTDVEEDSPEMVTFVNVIIGLVESFIRKGYGDND